VFPALGLVGAGRRPPDLDRQNTSIELPHPRIQPLLDACARNGVYAATSTPERIPGFDGQTFHTGFLVGPDGIVLRSPKAQAYSAAGVTPLRNFRAQYEARFGAESIYPVAETPLGRIGVLVEREIQLPEPARVVASRGADLIINLSAEGERAIEQFPVDATRVAAAYANCVYILSASFPRILFPSQDPPEDPYAGCGRIVDYEGRVIGSVSSSVDGYAAAWIDPQARRQRRTATATERVPVAELFPGAPGARPAEELLGGEVHLPKLYKD
jgi:predicted amidohydrolase